MFVVRPIGYVRSPFVEKAEAPRQAVASGAEGTAGQIVIEREHEHALSDLDGFERIWILFWFHRSASLGSSPSKVLPPRSDRKRGVFATRAPHRPNPIGMSAVRLERIDGLVLYVRDLDLLDGTPVLDLKPYLPYADAFPDAGAGWLDAREPRDPRDAWAVRFTDDAETQLAWLTGEGLALDLRARIGEALALGPQPHPYRRIKKTDRGLVLAIKDWRARFAVDAPTRTITVSALFSGYRPRELAAPGDANLVVHQAFAARFG